MTKSEFVQKLTAALNRSHVADAADIIEEYEQHFVFKLADGYSEEEIAAKLGDPDEIATQYDSASAQKGDCKRTLVAIGLGITGFFFGILCVLLIAWEIVMAALTLACGAAAVGLICSLHSALFAFIPAIPYHCALVFGIAFAALALLCAAGTAYFFAFIRQLMRAYKRFHQNGLRSASSAAPLPSLSAYPQFSGKAKRTLRLIATLAAVVFAVCLIVGFILSAASAGSLEFWHEWGWFTTAY